MFQVSLHHAGGIRFKLENIPAYKHANMWRIPDFSALAPHLNETVRTALQRATWDYAASDTLRADLTDKRGRPMGALIAQWGA